MKEKDDVLIIKITDKGAVYNCHIFATLLTVLLTIKQQGKATTIDEIKDDCIIQLKKSISWIKRPDDKTSTLEDKKEAKKTAEETIKFIEKIWKKPAM